MIGRYFTHGSENAGLDIKIYKFDTVKPAETSPCSYKLKQLTLKFVLSHSS